MKWWLNWPAFCQWLEGHITPSAYFNLSKQLPPPLCFCHQLDFDSCWSTLSRIKAVESTLFLYKRKINCWVYNNSEAKFESKVCRYTRTKVQLVFASNCVSVITRWLTSTCCMTHAFRNMLSEDDDLMFLWTKRPAIQPLNRHFKMQFIIRNCKKLSLF